MTTLLNRLKSCQNRAERRQAAEHINSHLEEFELMLSQVFGDDSTSIEDKLFVLDYVDFVTHSAAVTVIEYALKDDKPQVRIRGLQAAYRVRMESLNAEVKEILEDNEEVFQARKWAVHILATTDPNGYGRVLRKIARNSKEQVDLRKEAVFALTNIGDDESLGALCALLGDSEKLIRVSSAWSLSRIGSPSSINCMLAALEDEEEEVRDWAVRGLRDMDDSQALQGLADAMKLVQSGRQIRLIQLLAEKRSEIIQRAIAEMLLSTDSEVRRTAAWAMGVSPYPPAAGSLEQLLQDPDEQIREYARTALMMLGRIDPTDFGFKI
ncbi:MAG: HEAT repeat domain-containing protein [Candidatus Thorarchaeota archaeon]|nr:MAG: HEAT repeat domain-containing protein [Candidatus Thorarchaeota archaeon]